MLPRGPLLAGLRRSDYITDTLASFHWLRAPERVQFKLALLTFRALHGLAPVYLSSALRRIADIPTRRRLRSAASGRLDVPSMDSYIIAAGLKADLVFLGPNTTFDTACQCSRQRASQHCWLAAIVVVLEVCLVTAGSLTD
jgi:hypothetical protein